MMSHNDLQVLRLNDDLDQAHKEIEHLQDMNQKLMTERTTITSTIDGFSIENNALRLERDDLRNVINLADNGIAEINSHWKQKFFLWRETESQLLKELSENKENFFNQNQKIKHEHESKIEKIKQENQALKTKLEELSKDVHRLERKCDDKNSEIKDAQEKLMNESRNNLQYMFLTKEKEILDEKVKILETKVHSFYEDSLRQSQQPNISITRHEAERDYNLVATPEHSKLYSEVRLLKQDVHKKDLDTKNLQDEVSRLSCLNETQLSKIKQLKVMHDSANTSVAEAATNIQKEKAKFKKATVAIEELQSNVATLKKINNDLKTEMSLKFSLIDEKDKQIQHYKSCYTEQEVKINRTINEVEDYKHTLDLVENEKLVLQRDVDIQEQKHKSVKELSEKISEENETLLVELCACNEKISQLSKKYKEAELGNTDADRAMGQFQQDMIDVEVELHDKTLQLKDLEQENTVLKDEVAALMAENDDKNNTISEQNMLISKIQDEMSDYKSKFTNEMGTLQQELADKIIEFEKYRTDNDVMLGELQQEKECCDKSTSNATLNHVPVRNMGTFTDPEHDPVNQQNRLRHKILELGNASERKDKKLAHCKIEMNKQAATIVRNNCEIDRLKVKLASFKVSTSSSNQLEDQYSNVINDLHFKIQHQEELLAEKDSVIQDLHKAEDKLKDREKTFWELSELVNVLQKELDCKHTNILKEVNFYKSRLMEQENSTPTIDKAINTSTSLISQDIDNSSASSESQSAVDLEDLEKVMQNLKCEYMDELDTIHETFREEVSSHHSNTHCNHGHGEDSKDKETLQWIDLMVK